MRKEKKFEVEHFLSKLIVLVCRQLRSVIFGFVVNSTARCQIYMNFWCALCCGDEFMSTNRNYVIKNIANFKWLEYCLLKIDLALVWCHMCNWMRFIHTAQRLRLTMALRSNWNLIMNDWAAYCNVLQMHQNWYYVSRVASKCISVTARSFYSVR